MSHTTSVIEPAVQLDRNWKSKSWVFIKYVVGLFVSFIIALSALLDVIDKALHKPEDFGPLIYFYQHWIQTPIAAVIRYFAEASGLISSIHVIGWMQSIESSQLFASFTIMILGVCTLYFFLQKLLTLSGAEIAANELREFAIFILTLLSLPLSALGIIHLLKLLFQIELLPVGESIIADYRSVVHSLIDQLYWVPLHFFHWQIPSWLKDLAAISTVSVAMNRRAWLKDKTGHYELEWSKYWKWVVQDVKDVESVFDAVELIPELISMLFAQVLGRIILLSKWDWLAQRVASTAYVVFRGIMFVGLVYPIDHLWYYLRGWIKSAISIFEEGKSPDDLTPTEKFKLDWIIRRRDAARIYFIYFVILFVLVVSFLWGFGSGFMARN